MPRYNVTLVSDHAVVVVTVDSPDDEQAVDDAAKSYKDDTGYKFPYNQSSVELA